MIVNDNSSNAIAKGSSRARALNRRGSNLISNYDNDNCYYYYYDCYYDY